MSFELAACAISEKHAHPRFAGRTLAEVRVTLREHLERVYNHDLRVKVWADHADSAVDDEIDRALIAKAAHILRRTLPHAEIIADADGKVTRVKPAA
jgi:hypothetical protein